MKQMIDRLCIALLGAAILTGTASAQGDAANWVRGMPGGPELMLRMSGIDEAERSLRELSRSARLDWMPTARRLLMATNLTPGIDTARPIAFGFSTENAGDTPIVVFLAVIPADRPSLLAANFEALPSSDYPGLFEFEFAERRYVARVLPDDHLAISDSPRMLLDLREVGGPQPVAPVSFTMYGTSWLNTLGMLVESAGLSELPLGGSEPDDRMLPDDVKSVHIDLFPAVDALRLDVRVRAVADSEFAQSWKASNEPLSEPIPFPNTPEMLVMQGAMSDPVVRSLVNTLTDLLLGQTEFPIESVRSVSLLLEEFSNLASLASPVLSLAFTSNDAEDLRARLGTALAQRPGTTVTRNARTRVGVEIDRVRLSFSAGANQNGGRSDGSIRRNFPGGSSNRASNTIESRIFARHGRVYLTNASDGNGLDRLIAFGPESASIGTRSELAAWLSRLPEDATGRASVSLGSIARLLAMGAGSQGLQITVPDPLPPAVASMRTGDAEVHATLILPAEVVGLLEQIRRASAENGRSR